MKFVFYNSIWKNAVLFLISAPVPVTAVASIYWRGLPPGHIVFSAMFMGGIALLFGYRLFDRRPRVVIDESGINDLRSTLGVIPWNDIQAIRIMNFGKGEKLYVSPTNPLAWLEKASRATRFYWQLYGREKYCVQVVFFNMNIDVGSSEGFMNQMIERSRPNNSLQGRRPPTASAP